MVGELARKNLKVAQTEMRTKYDGKAKVRSFEVGDLVLVFLPIHRNPLTSKFFGPYAIKEKKSDTNYIIETPDRKKSQKLVHINNLKRYYARGTVTAAEVVEKGKEYEGVKWDEENSDTFDCGADVLAMLKNSDILTNVSLKLQHLTHEEEDVRELLEEYKSVCNDVPGPCNLIKHDVVLCENTCIIKQAPYRVGPCKRKGMRKEVKFLLQNGLAEPSDGSWASPACSS